MINLVSSDYYYFLQINEDWSGELDEQWEQPKDIGIQADVEWEDVINIDD